MHEQSADVLAKVDKVISVNVENTKKDSFDGCWVNEDGVPVATISDGVVSWANGPSTAMKQQSKDGFSVTLDGFASDLQASCSQDGKLTWSDGEVWKRSGNKAERTDKVGAGGAGMAERGDGCIHFHPAKKYGGRREFGKEDLDQPSDGGMMAHNPHTYMCDVHWDSKDILTGITFSSTFMSWADCWGALSPHAPEEVPRIRLLYNMTSRVALLELFSAATTNMMDAELVCDLASALEAMKTYVKDRVQPGEATPHAMVYQGVGPHFSPGGNHHPLLLENATSSYAGTWPSTYFMDSTQQLGIPQVVAQHGACVGGGAAQSLSSSSRVLDNRMSVSFGNLARGATPIMLLSQHLGSTIGQPNAVSLYLSDDTFSAYTALMGGWSRAIFNGPPNMKLNAYLLAERYAKTHGTETHAIKMHVPHDMDPVAREAYGFILGFKSAGGQFASTTKQKRKDAIEATQDDKDPNHLKLEVPENNATLWALQMMIEETWKIPVEEQVLMMEDGTVLDEETIEKIGMVSGDSGKKEPGITADTKIQLKFSDYGQAKAEYEQWQQNQQSTEEEWEGWSGDYDYDWDDDDEDEDEDEE